MPPALPLNSLLFHFTGKGEDDNVEGYDDQDDESIDQGISKSRSGACVDCKSVKVRCEYVPGERKCRRCQTKNLSCRPRERKKRKPADTHEQLQEKAHERDRTIQGLLLRYDELRADQKIREWMTRTSSSIQGRDVKDMSVSIRWKHKGNSPELAVVSHFHPGQTHHHLVIPDIVKYCALFPEEIDDLFRIFFDRINPYFSILDPDLHTPQYLIWSSPFLFTVICAIASRFYDARPDVYNLAMEFARDAAGNALVDGNRGIDVCQAYLLMAVYPVPKKKWVEDRSWLLMGVAIRMALELELNQPPPDSIDERERLNRTRTWLNCYCVDGSHAIQFGKMPMLRLDDYVARASRHWYRSSRMNAPFDVHLCAYVQIIILMAGWRSTMCNFQTRSIPNDFDIVVYSLEMQEKLSQELELWVKAYDEAYALNPLSICLYRGNTTQMITAYLRLVVLAVGFQHSIKHGLTRDTEVVIKSIDAARTVIQIMIERLYPTGYLRYAMQANFLYVSFAAAFLINLLRPKFLPLLSENLQQEVIQTVTRLIEVLQSKDVALDGRHTPALYSRFLSSLLRKHHVQSTSTGSEFQHSEMDCSTHQDHRQATPPNVYYWPDVGHTSPGAYVTHQVPDGKIYKQYGDADMDFSLRHFVTTVSQDLPPQTYDVSAAGVPDSLWPRRKVNMDWDNSSSFSGLEQFPELWR